ncbi:MAG TPA: hypothetical protein VGA90_05820 [Methylomirabilota bacterium]|jgi:hypothetical protein
MSENKFQRAELADLVGVIERLAGELSLAEEPARFAAALEDGAPIAGGRAASGSGSPR